MSRIKICIPPQVSSLLHRLEAGGFEAYAVGGCVRNSLMGLEASDYDITTSALPEEMKKVFAGTHLIETGIKHGTLTVIYGGVFTEITTYRTDGQYRDRRHPENVEFTKSLEKDLSRRDFTVNAIAYSEDKGIVDPFGGVSDIKNGILRCVGEPERRFDEDALRIMRALRFMAVYGFKPEEKTAFALHRQCELIKEISPERINSELCKLLCGNSDFLMQVLRKYWDVFAVIIPEITSCRGFQQHTKYHDRDVWEHTIAAVCSIEPVLHLRLAMLMHDLGKPSCYTFKNGSGHFKGHSSVSAEICQRVLKQLRFDNETLNKTLFLVKRHDMPMTDDPAMIKKHLNKFGSELYFDLLKVHKADDAAKAPVAQSRISAYNAAEKKAREIIAENDCYSLRDLALNGNDIKEIGLSGKAVGYALDLLLNAVIEEKCSNDKKSLLEYLQQNKEEMYIKPEKRNN